MSEAIPAALRRKPRQEFVSVRGLEHRVLRWGPPSRDPIMLMHGWLDTADTFQFMVDAFERDWPLVAFDWRGFGRSAWSPDGYWFPDYFADLDALLDQFCPDGPARLLGHSMGGNIAMLFAGIRPERVRRVVNLEGFGLPRSRPEEAPGRYREWLHQLREPPNFGEYRDHDDLAHLLLRRNPRLTPERAAFIARAWATETPEGRVRIVADPAHKRLNPYLYRRDEAEACWRNVTAPVLLLLAELSEYLPRLGEEGAVEHFRRCLPGICVEVMAGVSHVLHHEQPAAVAGRVERFLAEDGDPPSLSRALH